MAQKKQNSNVQENAGEFESSFGSFSPAWDGAPSLTELIEMYAPFWERIPESELVSLQAVHKEYPEEIVKQLILMIVTGRIFALNPLKNAPVIGIMYLEDIEHHLSYIEALFFDTTEGDIRFDNSKVPNELNQYGVFKFYGRSLTTLQSWSFKLHQHKTEAITSIEKGRTVVFNIPFTRLGNTTIPKNIFLFISKEEDGRFKISAESEGLYFRGVNKELFEQASSFVYKNMVSKADMRNEEQRVLREEFSFFYGALLDADFCPPAIHKDSCYKNSITKISYFLNKLKLKKKEVDTAISTIKKSIDIELLQQSNFDEQCSNADKHQIDSIEQHNNSEVKYSNVSEQNSNADEYQTDAREQQSDLLNDKNYIFKKVSEEVWYIKYESNEINVTKSLGYSYIYEILKSKNGLTFIELYKAVKGTEEFDQIKPDTIAMSENDKNKTIKYSTEHLELLSKQIEDLEIEYESALESDPAIALDVKDELDNKISLHNEMKKNVHEAHRNVELRGKNTTRISDAVSKCITRTLDKLIKQDKNIGGHFKESIITDSSTVPAIKRYRPKHPIDWKLE